MVDEALLKEVKEKMDAGAAAADVNDTLKVYELFKQVAEENDDLREELEDMDITIQMILTDADAKFWLKAHDGTMEFGKGVVDNPSFTFSATKEVGAGMLFGEVDATSAYMAGDITVEGNLQDAMAFQEIIELALEALEDKFEDL
jgi:putative sterol carrier protein